MRPGAHLAGLGSLRLRAVMERVEGGEVVVDLVVEEGQLQA